MTRHAASRALSLSLLLLLLLTCSPLGGGSFAAAQTVTTTDGNGNTIVENVTLDPNGLPTTSTISTVTAAPGVAATTTTTTPAVVTPTTTTTITTPDQQGGGGLGGGGVNNPGPVTNAGPGNTGEIITIKMTGQTSIITPTFSPTLVPSNPPAGTIYTNALPSLSHSSSNSAARRRGGGETAGGVAWIALVVAMVAGIAGGGVSVAA